MKKERVHHKLACIRPTTPEPTTPKPKKWGYFDTKYTYGPAEWKDHYEMCGGPDKRQSPIDFKETSGSFPWPPFVFKGYDVVPSNMRASNNGHGVAVFPTYDAVPTATLSGGELPDGDYVLAQFHWHWGSVNTQGSEHTVNGTKYPAEIHFVHYKEAYGNIAEALKYPDGLAVLGVFLEIIANDNPNYTPIISALDNVINAGQEASVTPFAVKNLLPDVTDDFYRYLGSLTTPTCNPVVVWTVLKKPVGISEAQLNKYRQLVDGNGLTFNDNFRPVQPDNNNTAYGLSPKVYWGYSGSGAPDKWATYFPMCGGTSQSPINLDTSATSYNGNGWAPWDFTNYDAKPAKTTVLNNGHTVQVTMELSPATKVATVQGGGLKSKYQFLQYHLHWGQDDTKGSEHLVDGKAFPAEIHLVHWNTKYPSLAEAFKHPDGLAVLGFFFSISNTNNPKLDKLINVLADVHKAGSSKELADFFPLQDLLPASLTDFCRYDGSLTTPTCNEIVTWTVFNDTIPISAAQMAEFRKPKDYADKSLDPNNRPTQPLNNRKIKKGESTPHWGYRAGDGPDQWKDTFPTCGLSQQSPIDLDDAKASGSYSWPNFHFSNYNVTPNNAVLLNNKHTVQVTLNISGGASIQGGDLHKEYTFLQLHFHWGSDDTKGSEHTVKGTSYPLEMHLVHINKKYSIAEAMVKPDGLAVLGIFFEVDANNNTGLDSIIKSLHKVKYGNTETEIDPFSLSTFIPIKDNEFWRYQGSLTTPTCNEIVTWTVFKNPHKISATQLAEFRTLEDGEGYPMVDNFRPPQPENNRTVFKGLNVLHWTYDGKYGTSSWPQTFPMCNGSSQSPVDFNQVHGTYAYDKFGFKNYDVLHNNYTITNNDHTAQVTIDMNKASSVQAGGLPGKYEFLQLHFHWGSNDSQGSEHTVNGSMYPLELHLVHWKTEYMNVSGALLNADGLAVLGIFFTISPTNNTKLDSIIAGLGKIKKSGSSELITAFPLSDLLPANVNDFYRYSGSLTTPTCNEIVQWTVFKEPVPISVTQMEEFRKIENKKGEAIVNNFRPAQNLNGRKVSDKDDKLHWSYDGATAAANWPKYFPLCDDSMQSPIDIVTSSAVTNTTWTKFTFNNYNTAPTKATLNNNGHGAQVSIETTTIPSMKEGNLPDEYVLAQFHFHWGANASIGSEHTYNTGTSKSYAAELHFVHFKKSYVTIAEAIKHADGLAVLGVWLEEDAANNAKLDSIVTGLANVVNKGDQTDITPFALQDLLPANTNQFYRYMGSLTTPTCNEVVIWTVFKEAIKISKSQLDAFRNIEDVVGDKIIKNYRPTQPLGTRTVTYADLP